MQLHSQPAPSNLHRYNTITKPDQLPNVHNEPTWIKTPEPNLQNWTTPRYQPIHCVLVLRFFFFLEAFKDMLNGLHNLTLKHQQAVFI